HRVAVLAGPDEAIEWEQRMADRASSLALEICQVDDDEIAADAVAAIMAALWPHGDPEDVGEADWWRTPLGRVCARSLGRSDAEAVTFSVAAAMLGVHKGTVSQLVDRGKLDRHPDGEIGRAHVCTPVTRKARMPSSACKQDEQHGE